jgi:CRISPR-associated protein Cas6
MWQDEEEVEYQIPDDVVDLSFSIECDCLPVDHAYALSAAILEILPWLHDEPEAGLHLIQGGASMNGWLAPESPEETILLSKRTKLRLRIPKTRAEDTAKLSGQTLDVAGNSMKIGKAKTLLLVNSNTLYARYVASECDEDEDAFTQRMISELKGMGLKFTKILSGRDHTIIGPDGEINTKSLMVSGLPVQDAVKLQILGVGPYQHMGIGLFVASKSI